MRFLLVPVGRTELPPWSWPEATFHHVAREGNAVEALGSTTYDAVVLVMGHNVSGADRIAASLQTACAPEVIPLVLAADGGDERTARHLTTFQYDGYLDLRWTEPLVRSCLELVLTHSRTGRGLAAIQREVLNSVGHDVAKLRELSIRDELSGLYNSRHFQEVIHREHQRCQRHLRSYALVMVDLDDLREINNTYGHLAGTRALSRLGATLAAVSRQSDTAFRLGGDEFAALLCEADRKDALKYAERLRKTFSSCVLTEQGSRIRLSASAGVASFPANGQTVEEICRSADAALYRAKAAGKDRVMCSEPFTRGRYAYGVTDKR